MEKIRDVEISILNQNENWLVILYMHVYVFQIFGKFYKKKNDSGNNKIFLVPSSPVNLKQ